MNKTIVFGDKIFDIKTFKDRDIMITNIFINSKDEIITISYEDMGEFELHVQRYKMSIQKAQEIGFINFDALNKVL